MDNATQIKIKNSNEILSYPYLVMNVLTDFNSNKLTAPLFNFKFKF